MVTQERFIVGINQYVNEEILPSIGGLMKWGAALRAGAYAGNIINSGVLKKLGYQTPDGMIDEDRLYNDLKNIVSASGTVTQNFPFIGDISFSMNDVESLYRRMK